MHARTHVCTGMVHVTASSYVVNCNAIFVGCFCSAIPSQNWGILVALSIGVVINSFIGVSVYMHASLLGARGAWMSGVPGFQGCLGASLLEAMHMQVCMHADMYVSLCVRARVRAHVHVHV